MQPITPPSDSPDAIARAFLAALDEGRWHDAADLVDPRTGERFRSFWIERLESEASGVPDDRPSDTLFTSASELLRVHDPAAAERLTPADMLARVAEASHPGNFIAHGRAGDGEIRITRTFLDSTPLGADRAQVRYRIEWRHGAVVSDMGVHAMELTRASGGWAVRDADLGGHGGGHIVPPPGEWE